MRPLKVVRHIQASVVLSILSVAGCGHPSMRLEQLSRGYVVMLPGIESSAWQFSGTVEGLREAGIERAVDVVEWGDHSSDSFANLTDLQRNQERATSIAFRIAGYQKTYPDAPITLIGYSGGGGLAVLVAEVLADDVQLDRIILIGAAISPDRDLTKLLSHCRRGMVNFYSERDWFMLGVGTSVMGTIDRKKTDSAGRVGFKLAGGELREEPGLIQIPWQKEWRQHGHNGSHVGWLSRGWAREVLAPEIAASATTRPAEQPVMVAGSRRDAGRNRKPPQLGSSRSAEAGLAPGAPRTARGPS